MLFLAVKRVHYLLRNNEWDDTHDAPAFEQLILCKKRNPDANKVANCKKLHCLCATPNLFFKPLMFFYLGVFLRKNNFSLNGTQPTRFPWYFLLFKFRYTIKDPLVYRLQMNKKFGNPWCRCKKYPHQDAKSFSRQVLQLLKTH